VEKDKEMGVMIPHHWLDQILYGPIKRKRLARNMAVAAMKLLSKGSALACFSAEDVKTCCMSEAEANAALQGLAKLRLISGPSYKVGEPVICHRELPELRRNINE
jgi:hypothetical protein